jgi:hypothetical protein
VQTKTRSDNGNCVTWLGKGETIVNFLGLAANYCPLLLPPCLCTKHAEKFLIVFQGHLISVIIPLQKEDGSYYAYSISDLRAIPILGVGLRTLPCDLCIFTFKKMYAACSIMGNAPGWVGWRGNIPKMRRDQTWLRSTSYLSSLIWECPHWPWWSFTLWINESLWTANYCPLVRQEWASTYTD